MWYEWIEHNLRDEPQVVYQSVSCFLAFNFCFQYFRATYFKEVSTWHRKGGQFS